MEDNRNDGSVYSSKLKAGKRRIYFFDVRKTKGEDLFLTITESTRKFNGDGFEKHKIFVYKEDFNRFIGELEEAINHVKSLMPDFDYDQFNRRDEEWAKQDQERDNEDETKKPLDSGEEISW